MEKEMPFWAACWTRSGDVTVLAWSGKSSPYNSCLPANLAVYSQTPRASLALKGADMDERVAALRDSPPREDVMLIYNRVTTLPPARFANRRLHLPSIIFAVKKLSVQDFGSGVEYRYRARAAGIGDVEFQTSDRLSLSGPRRLVFVHPWMCDLRDLFDGFTWGNTNTTVADAEEESNTNIPKIIEAMVGSEPAPSSSSPLHAVVTRASAPMDDHTLALRLVRLQQPFHALLLQQQPNGEFRRVATEHEIVVPGIERAIHVCRDACTRVVEIL